MQLEVGPEPLLYRQAAMEADLALHPEVVELRGPEARSRRCDRGKGGVRELRAGAGEGQ